MNKKIIIWIIVLLIFSQLVLAIGIRPAKTTLLSEEIEQKYGGTFWIINNDAREFSVNIYVTGEMSEYVQVSQTNIKFRADNEAEVVDFTINLPSSVPPGASTANIIIEEELPNLEPKVISSKVILKHKIIIQGPYPEKYISAKLNFHENEDTQLIEFISEVENLGQKDINSIKTIFYVNDREQKEHALETELTDLKKTENKLLKAQLDQDLFEQGEFVVSAITTFDDQSIEVSKKLLVGRPEVVLTYFNPYFIAYKINQYSLDLFNKWNQQIENVYVDVSVKKEQQEIDQFRTKSVDIEGEMTRRINDYLDAKDKGPGKYTFDLTVNFWNLVRMDQILFQQEVELVSESDAENLDLSSLTGAATGVSQIYTTSFIILMILLGIICGITITYLLWKKKNNNSESDLKNDEF